MSKLKKHSQSGRDLLFVSYAYEDEVFARWLARKLAFYGYGVWFDQIKLLGGESWVEEVDVAIKDRSFRVLALLSNDSIAKPHPRKERTSAQRVGQQLGIDDFLIPLNLDGTESDWKVSDISWISFRESWADGLRRLLKKLQSIDAPQIHKGNPEIARVELDRGGGILQKLPEQLVTNWLPITDLPNVLRVYDAPGLTKDELSSWPCFLFGEGKVGALSPPPDELEDQVEETPEVHCWPSVDEIRRSASHSVIVQILNRTVGMWLRKAGCEYREETRGTYIPDPFRDESIVRYEDADGSKRRIYASGKVTIKKPSAPPETVIHHPGIRYRARRTDVGSYAIELKPTLALFDHTQVPIEGKKIGPRRKKITRSWYNEKWRRRLMVFVQLLLEEAAKDSRTTFGLEAPYRLTSDLSLVEGYLKTESEEGEEEVTEQEVSVGMEEMEDWSE